MNVCENEVKVKCRVVGYLCEAEREEGVWMKEKGDKREEMEAHIGVD